MVEVPLALNRNKFVAMMPGTVAGPFRLVHASVYKAGIRIAFVFAPMKSDGNVLRAGQNACLYR